MQMADKEAQALADAQQKQLDGMRMAHAVLANAQLTKEEKRQNKQRKAELFAEKKRAALEDHKARFMHYNLPYFKEGDLAIHKPVMMGETRGFTNLAVPTTLKPSTLLG